VPHNCAVWAVAIGPVNNRAKQPRNNLVFIHVIVSDTSKLRPFTYNRKPKTLQLLQEMGFKRIRELGRKVTRLPHR
jgi:hypothetical protein